MTNTPAQLRTQIPIIIHMFRFSMIAALFALPVGCTNTPKVSQPHPPHVVESQHEPDPDPVVKRPISAESMYALLVAEMAIDRHRYDIALANYVQQAKNTKDPGVLQRATNIAQAINNRQSGLEMSLLWHSIAPNDVAAIRAATMELISSNRLDEAFELAVELLKSGEDSSLDNIAAKIDKNDSVKLQALIEKYRELTEQYKDPYLWAGYAFLLEKTRNYKESLKAINYAHELLPDDPRMAFQVYRILHISGDEQAAIGKLEELVDRFPQNIVIRTRYAHMLTKVDLDKAQEQFEELHRQRPDDNDIVYALALIAREKGEIDIAERHFKLLINRASHTDAAHFNLAQINKERDDIDASLAHLKSIREGDLYIDSVQLASQLILDESGLTEAIRYVQEEQKSAADNRQERLRLLESSVLSQSGQLSAAEQVLSNALLDFPDSKSLLYTRAMLYVDLGHIDAAETDLRRVLKLMPDDASILNALGYVLADNTTRYEEAYVYIKKAYQLEPTDPAIIDSMGWVEYKLGNYEVALKYLNEALKLMPDHEIAAHLGEVLWVYGQKEEAISVWKKALTKHPESEYIHKTIHQLDVSLD